MKQPAISKERASISRAQEITALQQRLAFILELERILKQGTAELGEAAKRTVRIQTGTVSHLAGGLCSTPSPSTRMSTEPHA